MRIKKLPFVQYIMIHILPFVGYVILELIAKTVRCKVIFKCGNNLPSCAIPVFWHGHQLLMGPLAKKRFVDGGKNKIYILISKHLDGRIIANLVKYIGFDSIDGSSSRNSKGASLEILKKLKEGNLYTAITPDGPRGPVRVAKQGAVVLSSLSQKPIIPMTYAFKSYWQFKSWDEMILAKPFTKATVIVGNPIYVPEDLSKEDEEKYRVMMQEKLNELYEEANNFE